MGLSLEWNFEVHREAYVAVAASAYLSEVNLFLAKTDLHWYRSHHAAQRDEVNFWRPSGQLLRALKPGEPLLFLLKAPVNKIAGFGYFTIAYQLPASRAWAYFEAENGVADKAALVARLHKYHQASANDPDPPVGCVVLNECVWLDEADFVDMPNDFASNIVTGKTYDAEVWEGLRVWQQVQFAAARYAHRAGEAPFGKTLDALPTLAEAPAASYGRAERKIRYGQGAFRTLVEAAYERCAISGERTRPVLQAAHIQPFSSSLDHSPSNGLFLRSDIHQLYDAGYVTVTPEYEVRVSSKLREKFSNGKIYYQHDGHPLVVLPKDVTSRPDVERLAWHGEKVWLG